MNKLIFFIGSLAISVLITGCPEEVGYYPETPLLIKNTSNDSLRLKIIYQRSEFSDSTILKSEISQSNLFSPIDESNGILFAGHEVKEYLKVSEERIEEVPFSLYVFLIDDDTLNQYTEETWNREVGVKRYYFYDLEDYEQIDFTMEYP